MFYIITLFTFMALIGCGTVATNPAKDTYRMPLTDKIQTLNPRELRALPDDQILKSIFDLLIVTDDDGYLKPSICYRWEISPDFKEFTFFIRNDAEFHDGVRLTAKDVIFSLEYEGRKPTLLHKVFMPIEGYADYYEGRTAHISGIQAPDDYTVVIRLSKPLSTFLYTLANSKLVILPADFHGAGEDIFFKRPVGTGQYMFKSWDGNELHLAANDKYFGPKGRIKHFVFTAMNKQTALGAFERHEVDDIVSYRVTPSEVKRTDVIITEGKAFVSQLIFFNVKRPPLDNVDLRLAIRAAVDIDKLVKTCYPHDDVANGVIPRGLVGALDDSHSFGDLDKPVDYYLSRARINRKTLPKMLLLRLNEVEDDCFKPTIEAMFRNAGLPVEVKFVSFEECVKRYEANDYYMLSESLAARNVEPINILNFFDGRSTHNLSNMNDNEINKLIDSAEIERMRGERGKIYRQISELIVKKAYAIDVLYENRYYIFDKAVLGIKDPSPMRYLVRPGDLSFVKN